MAVEIKMPQLSDTMNSGKILAWRKQEGEAVKRGEILAEVETDKANLEIENFHDGVLLKIVVQAQQSAEVGQAIAYIGKAGEEIVLDQLPAAQPLPAAASFPAAQNSQEEPPAARQSGRIKASPLARKIAEEKRIDLSLIRGSGPQGRILRRDLSDSERQHGVPGETGIRTRTAVVGRVDPRAQPPEQGGGTLLPLSKMRETIARRMQQSVQESPHFYTTVSVNMREALKFRSALKEEKLDKEISLNHMMIKAAAFALKREPRVNCCLREGQLYQPSEINIGVITAVEDGLLIPVVRNADRLSLYDVAIETRAAVERARAGRPSSSDLSGGTFSISNMGMFDVESFTAIISPGQGAVLSIGAVIDTPVAEDGRMVIAPIMKVTLGVDHRAIDGIMAAEFLKHFKRALEIPALLVA